MKGVNVGRERPGLSPKWPVPGPAGRVAHARCLWSACADECGLNRVHNNAWFLAQISVTIVSVVMLAIEFVCRRTRSRA